MMIRSLPLPSGAAAIAPAGVGPAAGRHTAPLIRPAFARHISRMTAPIFDFSHLTPDERIELAEQLSDSLEPAAINPDEERVAEL